MSNEKTWRQLVDGDRLHARHILELADEGQRIAGVILAAFSEGSVFISPPSATGGANEFVSSEESKRNLLWVNPEKGSVHLDNIAVLAGNGKMARVPPPAKSVDLPASGDPRCLLVLKVETLESSRGRGSSNPSWETPEQAIGADVVLAEWSEENQKLNLLPLPLLLGSQSDVRTKHQALKSACDELWETLVMAEPASLARIGVSAEQRHVFGPLIHALEQAQSQNSGTLASEAMRELQFLRQELAGWFRYVGAKAEAGSSLAVGPDSIGRRRLAALRGNDGLPEGFTSVVFPAPTATALIESLGALAAALTKFAHAISGQSNDVSLTPTHEFALPMGGRVYVYDLLAFAGKPCQFRVEVLTEVEPQLLWGVDTVNNPNLRPLEVTRAEGRFDAQVPALVPQADQKLAVGIRPASSPIKLFFSAARGI